MKTEAQPTLKWTTEPPTAPGWYWYDPGGVPGHETMVRVSGEPGCGLTAYWPEVDTWPVPVEPEDGICWAGPIPEPSE